MMKKLFYAAAFLGAALLGASCSESGPDDDGPQKIDFALTLRMPINVDSPELRSVEAVFTDVTTGEAVTSTEFTSAGGDAYVVTAALAAGTYNIEVEGVVGYLLGDEPEEGDIVASRNDVAVSDVAAALTVDTTVSTMRSDDFIIEEIFFTGSLTPEGNQYYGDQYMKITNNTDKTLYADGLVILKSAFMTTAKHDYTPDIMADYFSVDGGLVLPGSGHDYPVAPGGSIVIADSAIDHTEFNPNSLDLTGATFEFYNEQDDEDVDNPNVPNVRTLFADDWWTWHNRGFVAYAIGRLGEGVTAERFATDYAYTAEWVLAVEGFGEFDMSDDIWKFPNGWISDAVNLSVEEVFAWIVTSPTLDAGWTYCGRIDKDQTRYGKSVRRRVAREKEGRVIYKDTNDSSVDFVPEAVPSLMN